MEAAPPPFACKAEVLSPAGKRKAYEDAIRQLDSILAGETHMIVKMATINCVLREARYVKAPAATPAPLAITMIILDCEDSMSSSLQDR